MTEIDIFKTKLRAEYKTLRKVMDKKTKSDADIKILENLKKCSAFSSAETVLIYKSTELETGTELIISHCFEIGKRVALPRCKKGHKMDFYEYSRGEELEISGFGIAEPFENENRRITDFSNGICIVPGLAYDENGFRLGYGGGFYDRFLAENNIPSVGICYCEFVLKTLPHDIYDKKTDFLVTENNIKAFHNV